MPGRGPIAPRVSVPSVVGIDVFKYQFETAVTAITSSTIESTVIVNATLPLPPSTVSFTVIVSVATKSVPPVRAPVAATVTVPEDTLNCSDAPTPAPPPSTETVYVPSPNVEVPVIAPTV